MAKSRAELHAIMREDAKRRNAREAEELLKLVGYYDDVDYLASRGITGEPSNKNRTYHVMGSSWKFHNFHDADGNIRSTPMRAIGTDVTVTHADGSTETRAASSFRKQNVHKRQRAHATHTASERHRITAADLAPIGNIE